MFRLWEFENHECILLQGCNNNNFAEPLGSTSPRFSTEAHSQAFFKEESSSFAMLCPAQAYPSPKFQ